MQNNRCLYCYEPCGEAQEFHEKCSREFFGTPRSPVLEYSLEQMDELAQKVVDQRIAVPGVQAKLSMSLVRAVTTNEASRLTIVGALGGQYIFKPPSIQFPEMPQNEHVTMRMAEAFGIRVVPSSLIRLASGELSYMTKRIDRTTDGGKVHMIDMFQITEAADKYRGSIEKVGKAIDRFSSNTLLDKGYFFDLVLFSFLTGNSDMHLKNFSMIEGRSGWGLAPAYDLLNVWILFPDDTEDTALTLQGKKKKLKRAHFMHLGKELELTDRQVQRAFTRMTEKKPVAMEWIEKSFLSEEMKRQYKEVLEKKYAQIGIG